MFKTRIAGPAAKGKGRGRAAAAAASGSSSSTRLPAQEPLRPVPHFYFDDFNLKHRARLLRCGGQVAQNTTLVGDASQEVAVAATRMQLADPVAFDTRGGLGAEFRLCDSAARHPRRTGDITHAEIVLLCPYLHYNNLLGRSPECDVPSLGGKGHTARMLPFSKQAKGTEAWARKVPHLFLTVNEFAAYSYHTNGSPFGKPSPHWVMHANQDHFPTGVAPRPNHVMIPYMASAALLDPAVRDRADAIANGSEVVQDPLLLFFRGTLSYGCQPGGACPREKLRAAFIELNATDVEFSGEQQHSLGQRRTTLDYSLRRKEQASYVADMQRAVFCLAPSGHTCETRRFYDAIAAGCIPITVDCENNTYPFDERLDYTSFAAYYPMTEINTSPRRFLRCLRSLRNTPSFVRRMQQGLKMARKQLGYGPLGGTSNEEHAQNDVSDYEGALEQLLVSAVTPNRHTPRRIDVRNGPARLDHINTATDPPPLQQPRKGRNALDLRDACSIMHASA